MQEQQKSTEGQKSETFTPKIIKELKSFLVERMVDNMDIKSLVTYVTDDLDQYYSELSDKDFIEDAKNYWDDSFNDVVEEISLETLEKAFVENESKN